MKLTPIAATLCAMKWGRHVVTAPAIATMGQLALQEFVQLRRKQKEFKRGKRKTQAGEL